MFALSSLVQKAQQFIEPTLNIAGPTTSNQRPTKATLFRHQFRLPDSQNPLQEITAELTLSPHHTTRGSADEASPERNGVRATTTLGSYISVSSTSAFLLRVQAFSILLA